MTFSEAKAEQSRLTLVCKEAAQLLAEIAGEERGPMNLVPDRIKITPEYQAAKWATVHAIDDLRAFNATFTKAFKSELAEERRQRFA